MAPYHGVPGGRCLYLHLEQGWRPLRRQLTLAQTVEQVTTWLQESMSQ